MSEEWLIWSNEHCAWWRPNGRGYTLHRSEAGLYGTKEAQYICCDSRLPDGKPKEAMIDPKSFPLTQEEEMELKDTRIKALEQQLREKEEEIISLKVEVAESQGESNGLDFKVQDLTTKLSEAETRVKELEHFISVSVDCHLLEKFNQVVADKEKLESRLAQELERGKLKDAVVNVAKRFLIGHATLDALKDSLTAIDKPSGDK